MSLREKPRNDNTYLYFQKSDGKQIFVGKLGEITKYPDRAINAYEQINKKSTNYLDDSIKLISILPDRERKQYSSNLIKELEKQIDYISSLSDTQINGDRTKLRSEELEKTLEQIDIIVKDSKKKNAVKLSNELIEVAAGLAMKSFDKKTIIEIKKEIKTRLKE